LTRCRSLLSSEAHHNLKDRGSAERLHPELRPLAEAQRTETEAPRCGSEEPPIELLCAWLDPHRSARRHVASTIWFAIVRSWRGRARPRFTVGEEGEHGPMLLRMLLFECDGPRQHDDLACAARRQRKSSLRRAHVGQRPKHR